MSWYSVKRAEQKEKRRNEILMAGLDLFIRKGYAATKTSDIAKAVGMSEGLLFHYYESKEKLYLALLDISASGPQRMFEMGDMPPLKFFEAAAEGILDYTVNNPFVAKLFVLVSQAKNNEALPEDYRKQLMRQDAVEKSIQLIIQGQKEGTIKEGDPFALTVAYWMAIQGICENIARHPEMPAPKAEWIVDIIKRQKE
jgi:AcrR family transcriptional regulator